MSLVSSAGHVSYGARVCRETVAHAHVVLWMVPIVTLVRFLPNPAAQSRIGRPRKGPAEHSFNHRRPSSDASMDSPRKVLCNYDLRMSASAPETPEPPSVQEPGQTAAPTNTPLPLDAPSPAMQEMTAPSTLSDLSLAVFLESLYTLEIAPSDGLTPNMLSTAPVSNEEWGGMSVPDAMNGIAQFHETLGPLPASSPGAEYAESAFLQDDLVYSVPSDMRWWNLAWALPHPSQDTDSHETRSSDVGTPYSEKAESHPMSPVPEPSAAPAAEDPPKPCCSSKETSSVSAVPREYPVGKHDKVHCVPNPTGPGCSCLCESDLALLSLQRSLRSGPLAWDDSHNDETSRANAASSLVFTLSMSQSITKKCACSADCPTCKKDPSYEVSAGLLISTALQIYARALKVFQEVLISNGNGGCGCTASGTCTACPCNAEPRHVRAGEEPGVVDVRIGDFLPTPKNARKIALYAMKLELYDLERALAHVQDVAQRSLPHPPDTMKQVPPDAPPGACCAKKHLRRNHSKPRAPLRLNPIDQLIIRKLHAQLDEVLKTVENLEANENLTVP